MKSPGSWTRRSPPRTGPRPPPRTKPAFTRPPSGSSARRDRTPPPPPHQAGFYETAFRVLGRYLDDQKPKDVFFFEQGGAFVVRALVQTQAGIHHELIEFTNDDIAQMVAAGPNRR